MSTSALKQALLLLLGRLLCVEGLMFQLHPNNHKCLAENVHAKTLVTGEYEVSEVPNQVVHFQVIDQDSHVLANRQEAKGHGKFAFTTDKDTKFEICFVSSVQAGQSGLVHDITLTTKHGVEAKSYEGLADAAKLKPLEMQLKKLEDLSEAIVQDFAYMREREEQMRDTNESTSSRVMYFSLFGLCCLLGLATWQVLYLRRYFKAKKLIE
ncbi:transmembrane emp24 domain-containing protein bai-like [Pollicipes pollicipes]|uniref:transmembrane emp24 domain-containing protein bai-like n=1 Tax=Pollicipes pollicipes TaxID=41117 RepID=UPI00188547C2|nr:transmembrane emp24 domain-containing protein bai-like [Pollicipes pollicipes]XP_037072078.1 transmembrane emp24 domain-containing protein bai-like [Pollicipes pollicipes]XP_037072365.1 transmembrane emp24 domain-containing protein bai-like [Pollicipes pollicipes]